MHGPKISMKTGYEYAEAPSELSIIQSALRRSMIGGAPMMIVNQLMEDTHVKEEFSGG